MNVILQVLFAFLNLTDFVIHHPNHGNGHGNPLSNCANHFALGQYLGVRSHKTSARGAVECQSLVIAVTRRHCVDEVLKPTVLSLLSKGKSGKFLWFEDFEGRERLGFSK